MLTVFRGSIYAVLNAVAYEVVIIVLNKTAHNYIPILTDRTKLKIAFYCLRSICFFQGTRQ